MKKHLKTVALFLSLLLLLSLASCGAPQKAAPADTAPADTIPVDTAPADSAPVDAAPADTTPADVAPEYTEITLKIANSYSETDIISQTLSYMCDYIEEKSGRAVKFERYFGGTFCTMAEEFSYINTGAVDTIAMVEGPAGAQLEIFTNNRTASSMRESINIGNTLLNENEQTSPLLQKHAADANLHVLDYLPGGGAAIVCNFDASSFADLSGHPMGTAFRTAFLENLGFSAIQVSPGDVYESLSRGIIDAMDYSLSGAMGGRLYEVAPYIPRLNFYGATAAPTVNNDTWNKLYSDTQALFVEAYDAAMEWCVDSYTTLISEWVTEIESADGSVKDATPEDNRRFDNASAQNTWNTYSKMAEQVGLLDEYEVIFDVSLDLTGFDPVVK